MNNTNAQPHSHPDRLKKFEKNSALLTSEQPALMEAFWNVHKIATTAGALDTKTKELIALAISVAVHCDDCIAHHVNDALVAGATKEDISDALGVAVLMGGGASVVYATHALEALDEFSERFP